MVFTGLNQANYLVFIYLSQIIFQELSSEDSWFGLPLFGSQVLKTLLYPLQLLLVLLILLLRGFGEDICWLYLDRGLFNVAVIAGLFLPVAKLLLYQIFLVLRWLVKDM